MQSSNPNSYTLGFGAELFYDLDAIFNNKRDKRYGSFILTPAISYIKIQDLEASISPSLSYGIWFKNIAFLNQILPNHLECP